MSPVEVRDLGEPEAVVTHPLGASHQVRLAGTVVTRHVLQPGWSWEEHAQPEVGTPSCELYHRGVVLRGRMGIRTDEGEEVRAHIGSIFATWPDIRFDSRRTYVRDGLVVQEWTAMATHANEMRRGDLVAAPTGRTITWDGLDVIPYEGGLVKRKDVYSDSVSILRQVGLL